MGAVAALAIVPTTANADVDTGTVLVQGGTTITDSGLWANVVVPGFKKAYPQYTLQFVAVGTSQALINAENGQGDAVFTHAPPAEATFLAGGYSNEPFGRAIMYSDFLTVGTTSDPAKVLANAPNAAVAAYERIATAGAAGKADFVSRGDGSGTNIKELQIWALTNVPLNSLGEPGTPNTTTDAPWYHKAGLGQAQTVQIADQCPFSSHKCYAIVDRGTFNYLQTQHTISTLKIVSQGNPAPAPGGPGLLNNLYHAYAVKPGTTSRDVNVVGATALLNYLTSPAFEKAAAKYPSTRKPAFHPDAYPSIVTTTTFPTHYVKGSAGGITVSGTVSSLVPFSAALSNAPIEIMRTGKTTPVVTGTTGLDGGFSLNFVPTQRARRTRSCSRSSRTSVQTRWFSEN